MKFAKPLLLLITLGFAAFAQAQTYQLTHYFHNIGNSPKPYNGELTISDSFVTFTASSVIYPTEFFAFPNATGATLNDTAATITKERIAINKKGYYVKTIQGNVAKNYTIELSGDKAEKKAGIYYITLLAVPNSGPRFTIYFKAKLASAPTTP
jgi:hypothetical protein